MRKVFTASSLILCFCLLLTGCNLGGLLGRNDQTPANQESPINTAIVITDGAILYDEPGGNQVGTLAKGVTVTFRDTQTSRDQLWAECITPVEYTWILLSDLQVTANGGMSMIYSPDGAVSGGNVHVVVGPNGEMVIQPGNIDQDEIIYVPVPGVDEDESYESYDLSKLEGVWGCAPAQYSTVTTWYLGANGYALLEVGDGELNGNTFYINYPYQRLFGTYTVANGVFTFTVTEDWYYANGENIGKVYTYNFSETDKGFTLDGEEYIGFNTPGFYLDEVTGHTGGPTGNDLTDPNYQEPVVSKVPDEALGIWVSFERTASGQQIRRMWTFMENQTNMHPCIYQEHIFDNIGGGWEILPISPYTEYYFDSYNMRNGQMYADYGPDSFGPYDLNIQGDTMTITHTNWDGVTETHTYTRTTNSNPKPN